MYKRQDIERRIQNRRRTKEDVNAILDRLCVLAAVSYTHLTRAVKIDAPVYLTRIDYGYQSSKFKAVPFGIFYGLVMVTFIASVIGILK